MQARTAVENWKRRQKTVVDDDEEFQEKQDSRKHEIKQGVRW